MGWQIMSTSTAMGVSDLESSGTASSLILAAPNKERYYDSFSWNAKIYHTESKSKGFAVNMENIALHFAITSTCSRYIIFSIHFLMCYSWNLTQTHSLTSQCYNLGSAPNIGCFFLISVLWKILSYFFTFMTDIVLIFYDLYFLIFRILAIKSGPSSGIKVFLQQSQKDNKNRVILPDVKWQSVGADYQQVDLSKFEGRNFASKLELLLATFSHDSSSSSS